MITPERKSELECTLYAVQEIRTGNPYQTTGEALERVRLDKFRWECITNRVNEKLPPESRLSPDYVYSIYEGLRYIFRNGLGYSKTNARLETDRAIVPFSRLFGQNHMHALSTDAFSATWRDYFGPPNPNLQKLLAKFDEDPIECSEGLLDTAINDVQHSAFAVYKRMENDRNLNVDFYQKRLIAAFVEEWKSDTNRLGFFGVDPLAVERGTNDFIQEVKKNFVIRPNPFAERSKGNPTEIRSFENYKSFMIQILSRHRSFLASFLD